MGRTVGGAVGGLISYAYGVNSRGAGGRARLVVPSFEPSQANGRLTVANRPPRDRNDLPAPAMDRHATRLRRYATAMGWPGKTIGRDATPTSRDGTIIGQDATTNSRDATAIDSDPYICQRHSMSINQDAIVMTVP
jgi:hypothetical protein